MCIKKESATNTLAAEVSALKCLSAWPTRFGIADPLPRGRVFHHWTTASTTLDAAHYSQPLSSGMSTSLTYVHQPLPYLKSLSKLWAHPPTSRSNCKFSDKVPPPFHSHGDYTLYREYITLQANLITLWSKKRGPVNICRLQSKVGLPQKSWYSSTSQRRRSSTYPLSPQ